MDACIRKVYRCGIITVLSLMLVTPVFGEQVWIPAKPFTPLPQAKIAKVVENDKITYIDGQSIKISPPQVVEKVGYDCFGLNPVVVNCKTEDCCFDKIKGTLKGVETATEDDIFPKLLKIDKDYKDKGNEAIVFNYRTDTYAQSVINLSIRIQMVMLNESYGDGERRAAIKLLRDNHDKYVFDLYNR